MKLEDQSYSQYIMYVMYTDDFEEHYQFKLQPEENINLQTKYDYIHKEKILV